MDTQGQIPVEAGMQGEEGVQGEVVPPLVTCQARCHQPHSPTPSPTSVVKPLVLGESRSCPMTDHTPPCVAAAPTPRAHTPTSTASLAWSSLLDSGHCGPSTGRSRAQGVARRLAGVYERLQLSAGTSPQGPQWASLSIPIAPTGVCARALKSRLHPSPAWAPATAGSRPPSLLLTPEMHGGHSGREGPPCTASSAAAHSWQLLPQGSGQAFREETAWLLGKRLEAGTWFRQRAPRVCQPEASRLPSGSGCAGPALELGRYGADSLCSSSSNLQPVPRQWSGLTLPPGARGQGHLGGTPGRPSLCPDGCSGQEVSQTPPGGQTQATSCTGCSGLCLDGAVPVFGQETAVR